MDPVTVFIERCPALLESYSRKCAYRCIIGKTKNDDDEKWVIVDCRFVQLRRCVGLFRRRDVRLQHTDTGVQPLRRHSAATCTYCIDAALCCSSAVLGPTVGHTMDALSPFISVLCHSG